WRPGLFSDAPSGRQNTGQVVGCRRASRQRGDDAPPTPDVSWCVVAGQARLDAPYEMARPIRGAGGRDARAPQTQTTSVLLLVPLLGEPRVFGRALGVVTG